MAAISVLSTNMAVLGEDSWVSLWLLGTVNNTAHCIAYTAVSGQKLKIRTYIKQGREGYALCREMEGRERGL